MSEVLEDVMETRGLVGQKSFTMKNSVKAFNILSDSLYMNKVLAVIRELSCNAADAQIEAGTSQIPFEIHLPDELSPYFFIRDFGTGLTHDSVLNLYTTYFDSTKTDSTDATGALGLGSKSPFAVVDDFTVVSYQDGKARTYFAYKNDEGFPCISFVSEDLAETESNGIKIQFAVRKDKFIDFRNNLPIALYHFEPKPTILNVPTSVKRETVSFAGDKWEVAAKGSLQVGYYLGDKPIIVMAKISYPLDVEQLRHLLPEDDHYLLDVCQVPIRIYVDNRTVDHTPSREHLQYNKKTISTVKKRLQEIYDEIFAKVKEEFAECSMLHEISERCAYLSKITPSNIRVDPWKSKKRVFGPNEFEQVASIFSHEVLVGEYGKNTGLSVNLKNIFANAGIVNYNNLNTVAVLSDKDFDLFDANSAALVFGRIECKSFDQHTNVVVKTDHEILENVKANPNSPHHTFELLKEVDLRKVRGVIRNRKVLHKHTVTVNSKNIVEVNADGGKVTTNQVDRDNTRISVKVNKYFIDPVFVIDDYPKDASAIIRAAYARMLTRGYTDFIVFTNSHRSGGRFLNEESKIFEATIRNLGKNVNVKVVKASEIEIPEIIAKPEPKSVMDRSEYCAFNILHYDESYDKFKETQADKMPEPFQLPSFEEDSVIYFRRRYNDLYLFGDEDSKIAVSHNYKIGDSRYFEVEELIRLLSVFSGRNIIEDKVLVIVKTKSQYEKAQKKSKWKSISDVISDCLKSLTDDEVKQLAFTLALSRRNSLHNLLADMDVWKTFQNSLKVKAQYEYREKATASASFMTGLVANWFCTTSLSTKKGEEVLKQINETLAALPKCKIKSFLETATKYFEKNELLRDEHHMFNYFCSSKDGSTYSPKSLFLKPTELQKIVHAVLGSKFVVHLNEFVLKCQEFREHYPMLELYNSRFSHDETSFTSQNVSRSNQSIKLVADYINLIEGTKHNV